MPTNKTHRILAPWPVIWRDTKKEWQAVRKMLKETALMLGFLVLLELLCWRT